MGTQYGGPPEVINEVPMKEDVNQYRVASGKDNCFYIWEQDVKANPGEYNQIVIEFDYPDPAPGATGPGGLADIERVPTRFEVTWLDSAGVFDDQGFKNVS